MEAAASFELFDHTADIGVRVRGPSCAALVAPAINGLYAVIGNVVADTTTAAPWSFAAAGDEPALRLRDCLADVLLRFDRDQRCVTELQVVTFDDQRLHVRGQSRPIDLERSDLEREVKAVTYHELALRPVAGGFELTYIVDI